MSDHFAILRHLITLLFGENRGLEELRRIVAVRSGVDRVDVPIPYEPDQDIIPFEESDVVTRAQVFIAAGWLYENWPERFINCCVEAQVNYPALNRNAIAVRSYGDVASAAYASAKSYMVRKSVKGDHRGRIEHKTA